MSIKSLKFLFSFIALACMVLPSSALAQVDTLESDDKIIDILPAKSVNMEAMGVDADSETHPPLKLTPDKSELIRLDRDAFTVIVGNPLHLNVLADSSDTLILVGRAPGASHFMVLDAKGEVVMSRHVVVASPQKKYVRVRSSCANGGSNCQPTRVYYCPDMCHQVLIDSDSETSMPANLPGATDGTPTSAGTQLDEELVDEGETP